jgi:hypothetical protein
MMFKMDMFAHVFLYLLHIDVRTAVHCRSDGVYIVCRCHWHFAKNRHAAVRRYNGVVLCVVYNTVCIILMHYKSNLAASHNSAASVYTEALHGFTHSQADLHALRLQQSIKHCVYLIFTLIHAYICTGAQDRQRHNRINLLS